MGNQSFFTRIHFHGTLSKQVASCLTEMYQQQDTGITEAHQADVWRPDSGYYSGPAPGDDIPQQPRSGRRVTRRGQADRRNQEELNHAGVGYLAPETLINSTQPAFAVLVRGLSNHQQEVCKKIRQRGLIKQEARKSRRRKEDELEDLKMKVQMKLVIKDALAEESERIQEELVIVRFHYEPVTEKDFQ